MTVISRRNRHPTQILKKLVPLLKVFFFSFLGSQDEDIAGIVDLSDFSDLSIHDLKGGGKERDRNNCKS